MNDFRDVTNQPLAVQAQEIVRAELVAAGAFVDAENEWLCLTTLNPQQVTGFIKLFVDSGSFYAESGSPFFVSGRQRFTLDTGAGVLLQRASREELLSTPGRGREYPADGAGFSDVYDDTFSIGFAAGNWAYLAETAPGSGVLQWQAGLIGILPTTAFPFGWAAANKNFAGRYYTVEFESASTAPAVNHYANIYGPAAGLTSMGPSCSLDLTVIQGSVSIGDVSSAILSGPSYGPTAFASTAVMSRSLWTVVLRPTAAGATTFGGSMKIIRRGF